MNIFGKNIDDDTIAKLVETLNGPEGEALKKKFSNVDKTVLLKQFEKLDLSTVNENSISDLLSNTDNKKLFEMLNKINPSDLKR